MPRNMSFSMTTDQIRNRTKTVTRRIGWADLKPGEVLNACVKCMGLKPGEKIERLGLIRVVKVHEELLCEMTGQYGNEEADKEGFPELTGDGFVAMFCHHLRAPRTQIVHRIEFEYVD